MFEKSRLRFQEGCSNAGALPTDIYDWEDQYRVDLDCIGSTQLTSFCLLPSFASLQHSSHAASPTTVPSTFHNFHATPFQASSPQISPQQQPFSGNPRPRSSSSVEGEKQKQPRKSRHKGTKGKGELAVSLVGAESGLQVRASWPPPSGESRKLLHQGELSAFDSPPIGPAGLQVQSLVANATSKRAASASAATSRSGGVTQKDPSSMVAAADHRVSDFVREGKLSKSLDFKALQKAVNSGGVFDELLRRESQAEAEERLRVIFSFSVILKNKGLEAIFFFILQTEYFRSRLENSPTPVRLNVNQENLDSQWRPGELTPVALQGDGAESLKRPQDSLQVLII